MGNHKDVFASIRQLLAAELDPSDLERRLWDECGEQCAPLVLDSCGCTRVTEAKGIVHFLACVVRCRDVLQPVFERHGGLSFRPEVDNVYSEFRTPDQAFEASVEANRAIVEANLMLTDSEPFRVCIGIGYGRVLRSGAEGVFGQEMNLASKLGEDTAEGGEILLTGSAYANLSEKHRDRFERRTMIISGVDIAYYATSCA